MRLITGEEIASGLDVPGSRLQIADFSAEHIQHAWYYVRLGPKYSRLTDELVVDVRGYLTPLSPFLNFAPGEYVRVWSYESFRLDGTVLGELHGVSDTPRRALDLVAGGTIDPFFPFGAPDETAPLEFGLKNESQSHSAIELGDVIAKVYFFDVSDSSLKMQPGSLVERKMSERKIHAGDARLRDVSSSTEK